jgi:hypothetical protein
MGVEEVHENLLETSDLVVVLECAGELLPLVCPNFLDGSVQFGRFRVPLYGLA